ncbi:alpha-L-fucosidase [uncultured Sunxiuqinia sp.]|uniref:alpha-L-fucosidase n=1 Tax=uncultured Sunxiuqinia sp. TaxID=1573825 RepID=UPI002608157B|nr:alpha-L-fucosidase [uncultured Sunxiuqinia sp.]
MENIIMFFVKRSLPLLVIAAFMLFGCNRPEKVIFEPTVKSLRQYETPKWFKDAKFGIYCHWNAQSASKSSNNGWYARYMYEQGHPAYNDHLKNWGHPSEVGYKDIIEAWNADKFDAENWVRQFKDAGAKYVLTMAVHHDNFDFWDSKYQPKWNSLNYGPKVDVCGQMKQACEKEGLRWGVRTHLGRTYSWFQTNKGADSEGPKKGVAYDGNDPAYEDLYLEKAKPEQIGTTHSQIRHPLTPSEKWMTEWKNRMFDLIDNYHPDHFYFDGAIPFMNDSGKSGMEVIAHYYNDNASRHNGKNEGVMVIKDIKEHGFYYEGISSVVLERTRENNIVYPARETENSTGPWFYNGNETGYRTSKSLLHEMIDVVSKNCNFVLNIPPKPDGSFDDSSLEILQDFGFWLSKYGEAIYSSRPWKTFSEGDIRFTVNNKHLYAIFLNRPSGKTVIGSLAKWSEKDIASVDLVGYNNKLNWKVSESGLELTIPESLDDEMAYVVKISCKKIPSELPYSIVNLNSSEEENKKNKERYGADGHGKVAMPENVKS